ncbi:MAG: hypothetical protein N0C84_00965 [Candidatus Thiodiazotropha taylori]|uniref:ParB/Sulfiredoxin domain-containing protein n=1 Tax=Candidatus Thiodiazotropha taylori TaxID=2792791 RepID=A0A9E4KAB3_9GAMM|nr:hypothetical protein [Candidatus Thiodiazotropha taylori]MCW4255016.1 hypothetical protein [Candidatus Thiodiazotropha taylori]
MRDEVVYNIDDLVPQHKVSELNIKYLEEKIGDKDAYSVFPPISVQNNVIENGHHRVHILKKRGHTTVRAYKEQ